MNELNQCNQNIAQFKVDVKLEKCVNWLNRNSFKKVVLQVDQDFECHATAVVQFLQLHSTNDVYIVSDSTYENCCCDKLSAEHIRADACIHLGHACLSSINILPAFYVFPERYLDLNIFYKEFYKYFSDDSVKIIFFYDISYSHVVDKIYNTVKLKYKNFVLSTLNCTSDRTQEIFSDCSTSILGRVYGLPCGHGLDSYHAVFLGPDDKTLMILSMSISAHTWHYFDGTKFCKYEISKSQWLKKRNYMIERIKDAETFGIIVASLNVNYYLPAIEMLKNVLKEVRKKVYLFILGKISPTKLANFQQVDIFITISCPESSIINSKEYFKPIVTPFEVDVAFNTNRPFTSHYTIDFKQLLSGGFSYRCFKTNYEADVSLIRNNKIRTVVHTTADNTSATSSQTIINNEIVNNFLVTRTWKGLDHNTSKCEINAAISGRDGLPVNYVNELLNEE